MKPLRNTTYKIIMVSLLCAIVGTSYLFGYQRGSIDGKNKSVVIDYTTIPKEFVVSADTYVQKPPVVSSGNFFGSKSGTKYYASSTCASAKRIKPENYVWFTSKEDAEIQGYTRGAC